MSINGYKYVYLPNHHRANSSGIVYEHIIVAEQILGRELKDDEVVHHIDGNRSNNDPSNLMVFQTLADHAAYHKGTKAVKDVDGTYYCPDKSMKGKIMCPICNNNLIYTSSIMCKQCRINKNRENFPDKDKLLKEISSNKSMIQIGKDFGVTDNAVRRWCRFYNLPYKQEDRLKFFNI